MGYGHIDPTRLIYAPVAQLVEQLAFNQLAGGSSPFRRTIGEPGEPTNNIFIGPVFCLGSLHIV